MVIRWEMRPHIKNAIKKIDTKDWKKVSVEFGRDALEVLVPPNCVELSMKGVPVLSDPNEAIEKALLNPIGSPPLEEIIRKKREAPGEISVAIAVSDITRPVPYRGKNGILIPILKRIESSGIPKQNIKIIVATGMHQPSTNEEKLEMYGQEIVEQYRISGHDCEDNDFLENIGKTQGVTNVYVNRDFYFSDLKIATGLVESHFMTGISGGRNPSALDWWMSRLYRGFTVWNILKTPIPTTSFWKGILVMKKRWRWRRRLESILLSTQLSTRICE